MSVCSPPMVPVAVRRTTVHVRAFHLLHHTPNTLVILLYGRRAKGTPAFVALLHASQRAGGCPDRCHGAKIPLKLPSSIAGKHAASILTAPSLSTKAPHLLSPSSVSPAPTCYLVRWSHVLQRIRTFLPIGTAAFSSKSTPLSYTCRHSPPAHRLRFVRRRRLS